MSLSKPSEAIVMFASPPEGVQGPGIKLMGYVSVLTIPKLAKVSFTSENGFGRHGHRRRD